MSKIFVDEIAGIASADTVAIPGHVIQVVQDTSNTYQEISSTSYTTLSNLSASITPSSTSNTILVLVQIPATLIRATNDRQAVKLKVLRGTTTVYEDDQGLRLGAGTDNSGEIFLSSYIGCHKIDSPASTSALTYTAQMAAETTSNSGRVRMNNYSGGSAISTSSITLMEIAG